MKKQTPFKRKPERGSTDLAIVQMVLDAALIAHISYTLHGKVVVIPTMFWRDNQEIFWHGSIASTMLKEQAKGLQVCVSVSLLDGLILAHSAFNHSANYRSVVINGECQPVTNLEEKRHAAHTFMERLFPGRDALLRPVTDKELNATHILKMSLTTATAKCHSSGVIEDSEDAAWPCWAGVIPVLTQLGAPIKDSLCVKDYPVPTVRL